MEIGAGGVSGGGAGFDAGRESERFVRKAGRDCAEVRGCEDALWRESSGVPEGGGAGRGAAAAVGGGAPERGAAGCGGIPAVCGSRDDSSESCRGNEGAI